MAVPAYLRQESKAEFITVATRLAAWTLKWCKDECLFSRRERWIVTGDIWTAAKGVLTCAKCANARRDLTDPVIYAEREKHLRAALDHITTMNVLLTIKYEMVLQGFDTVRQAAPAQAVKEAENGTQPAKKQKRGGRKVLTQDDIDRVFEIFFDMTIHEKGLIEGLMQSDATRHAAPRPDSGPATPPRASGVAR